MVEIETVSSGQHTVFIILDGAVSKITTAVVICRTFKLAMEENQ